MDRRPAPPKRTSTDGRRAIFGRVVNSCWALFRGVLTLAVVLTAALAVFLYFRLDDEAQRLCEAALNRHCQPFVAHVGEARFTPGRGVTMYNVEIVERVPFKAPRGVLQVEELQVLGRFDVGTLLQGAPVVTRIVAKTPRLAATRREDGTWNVADFRPKQGGGADPRIELQNGAIVLVNEADGSTVGLRNINATVQPSPDAAGQLLVHAEGRDDHAGAFRADGSLSKDGKTVRLDYALEGVEVSSERCAALSKFGSFAPVPTPFGARVSASGEVARSPDGPLAWRAEFHLTEGVVRVPGFRRSLADIDIAGEARDDGLRVDVATASWGGTGVRLAGSKVGWGLRSPFSLRCRVNDYDLASTPTLLLPGQVAKLWRRFRPLGQVDVDFDLAYDGARFAPRATINARDASFEDSERFPYRLTQGGGRILVNGGASESPTLPRPGQPTKVEVRLQGMADDSPVLVTAVFDDVLEAHDPATGPRPPMPLGWVEIAGNGVPISDRLVGAIPEAGARDFVQSLHPTGRVDVRWRAERDHHTGTKPRLALDMRLVDCRLNYDRFPYPLSRVTGWVRQRDKQWEFSELRSRDPQGRTIVSGAGSLGEVEDSCRFSLRLEGEATPLDQTLYDALPSDSQQAWQLLRPRGQIDFVADVSRECGQAAPDVRLTMRPHQRNLAIEPPLSENGYRYRLENVDGEFRWSEGRLAMQNARAEHGRTSYATDGVWQSLGNDGWKLELLGLNADRLAFNRDFLLAAPAGLRAVVEELNPRGAFDLFDSRLEVTQGSGPSATTTARWRLGLSCHQASFDTGVPIDGVSGVVRLSGQADGATAATAGELDLDSMFWNDLQLTQVRGPLWADGTDCFLGEGASRKLQVNQPRPITARAYDGAVEINSWVRKDAQTRYGLAIGMKGVNVTRLSSEWLQRPETLQGSLDGQLELQGVGASIYGLTGRGAMAVSDADLYELPLFLSLLKYLRNRTPDNTAFNTLQTQFTIDGEDINFESFDLVGDAISLYGKGTASLDRQVDLTFASIVGRNEFAVPVLKAFVSSASEQLLRLRVVGPIDAPEVRREVLPMVGNVLDQLQNDFGSRVTAGAPRTDNRTRR